MLVKKKRQLLSIIISLTMVAGLFSSMTAMTVLASETAFTAEGNSIGELKFDFGAPTSPVAAGYLQVTNTMTYTSERGYGIVGSPSNRDRGAPDDLRRDFVNGSSYSFQVDVPNGSYQVAVLSGDQIASNRTSVAVEGISIGTAVSSTGSFIELKAAVTVEDGQMNFVFGNDGRVNAIVITPAIAAPSGLALVEMTLLPEASVTLGWNGSVAASTYYIYRQGQSDEAPIRIGSSTKPEYTDETVDLGASYLYFVSQVTEAGVESAKSESAAVRLLDEQVTAPAAPDNLQIVSASENAVAFSWGAVDDAVFYYIYRSASESGGFALIGRAEGHSYTDAAVITTTPFYYKIAAVNTGGISEPSSVLRSPIAKWVRRQMEVIDRSPVAVKTDNGVYVGWRLLGSDPPETAFNLYRDHVRINNAPIEGSTNYEDEEGTLHSVYEIRAVVNGREQAAGDPFAVWNDQSLTIPLRKPADGVTPSGEAYTYRANDASVGDVDGDGQYEIILKWDPSNSKDNSQSGYTGNVYIDAYRMDGTFLWRIDLGRNIRAGAHYTQFMVYDLDGDGRAEVAMKTADATVDGTGVVIGNGSADYRNSSGYILSGPEYYTVFEGLTGKALATTSYEPPRGTVSSWGDSYGNRVDRFLAGIAYLDGEQPSVVVARGYYTRTVLVAYNYRDGQLTKQWTFDSNTAGNSAYVAQGNHSLAVADVDGDGKDEIIYGSMGVDDDGKGMYTTGRDSHGDALHVSDLDPTREGLEVFGTHESTSAPYGYDVRDAKTGQTIWGIKTGKDTGRGLAADIDPRYAGAEVWAVDGEWNSPTGGLYSIKGEKISNQIPTANFAIWWDGDLLRELLDHKWDAASNTGVGVIDKWDYQNNRLVQLLRADGTLSNNTTKGTPALQADLFGDWREEVIWRTEDSTALRLYTTTDVTAHRITTLMHDPTYRLAIAWQNVAYNQPPHPGFFLGDGMAEPEPPNIIVNQVKASSLTVTGEGKVSEVKLGQTLQMLASVQPAVASNQTVQWSISAENGQPTELAVISADGLLQAKAAGRVRVTAEAQDGSDVEGSAVITIVSEAAAAFLAGPAQVNAGETFELVYGLRNIEGLVLAQDITINFDEQHLAFVGFAEVGMKAGFQLIEHEAEGGQLRFIAIDVGEDDGVSNEQLIAIKFRALAADDAATSSITIAKATIGLEEGDETEIEGSSLTISIAVADKTALLALIEEAAEWHEAAIEGTAVGQYPVGSKAQLQAAITAASEIAADRNASNEQITQAVAALGAALQTFKDAIIKAQQGDINGDGRYSIGDLALVAAAYGKTNTDEDWSLYSRLDFNHDGAIGIEDLVFVARLILGKE